MGSESQLLAHLWQNGFRWTEIGMKFWMKLTWKGEGWVAGSWAVITEFWELFWFYLPGGGREKSENVKLGGRGKEGKNISKHDSNHRILEGGERWKNECVKWQKCVCGGGGTEREVNLSVVSERRERGGQQVVWFPLLSSPPPPLPHLFIYCWANSSPSLLHKDPICLFCLSLSPLSLPPSVLTLDSVKKNKTFSAL